MRWVSVLSLLMTACGEGRSLGASDLGIDAPRDMRAPDPDLAPDVGPDAPPPIACDVCVQECLMAQCPTSYAACLASQCPSPDGGVADGGPVDGGGTDASLPPNCAAIAACLILNQCNPLEGPGTPCFDACYGPACASAQATFDTLLQCAIDECVDDCFGCV